MIQLEIQVVLHPDVLLFSQENFYQAKPGVVVVIMN